MLSPINSGCPLKKVCRLSACMLRVSGFRFNSSGTSNGQLAILAVLKRQTPKFSLPLGMQVHDLVTGVGGTIIGRTQHITGRDSYTIQPHGDIGSLYEVDGQRLAHCTMNDNVVEIINKAFPPQ